MLRTDYMHLSQEVRRIPQLSVFVKDQETRGKSSIYVIDPCPTSGSALAMTPEKKCVHTSYSTRQSLEEILRDNLLYLLHTLLLMIGEG